MAEEEEGVAEVDDVVVDVVEDGVAEVFVTQICVVGADLPEDDRPGGDLP